MKVYKYKDYDHYVERQTFYNKKKLHWVLIKEEHIEWMVSRCSFPSTIICHGTRSGKEQQLFKKHTGPSSYVIGTEISETATKFPMTVQHDFNQAKKEWINKFDIIYSNSIDHAFNIAKTITIWSNQLNKNGKLFIEKSTDLNYRAWDPIEISDREIKELFVKLKLKMTNKFPSTGLKGRQRTIVYGVIK